MVGVADIDMFHTGNASLLYMYFDGSVVVCSFGDYKLLSIGYWIHKSADIA